MEDREFAMERDIPAPTGFCPSFDRFEQDFSGWLWLRVWDRSMIFDRRKRLAKENNEGREKF